MNDPLVSVIIAVKNGEAYLADAIESVLAQTYTRFELIVIDGQSTDKTPLIARSYSQVRYVLQVRPGISEGYNLGIAESRGEFIAFLSSDDYWTPQKLEVQVRHMLRHPELQYTIARIKFYLQDGMAVPPGFNPKLLHGDHVGRIMETLVTRRTAFKIVGTFLPDMAVAGDVDWFARAKDLDIPMDVIPEVLLYKRIHTANLSLSDPQLNNRLLLKILRQSIHRQRRRQAPGDES